MAHPVRLEIRNRPVEMAFGLIVVGDEILLGHRRDRHFDGIGALLRERGLSLAWFRILPDDPDRLVREFRRTLGDGTPVLCCGGIGATPDDHTRQAAARAADLPLLRHPGAVVEIEGRFGDGAYPTRIRMAELPAGADLIPNPINRVPGFSLRGHHFLPGFPEMAHPMAAWVLDRVPAGVLAPQQQRSVWVIDATETDLMSLMERLAAEFPDLSLFSLPRLGLQKRVELGFRGRGEIGSAFDALLVGLREGGFEYEVRGDT